MRQPWFYSDQILSARIDVNADGIFRLIQFNIFLGYTSYFLFVAKFTNIETRSNGNPHFVAFVEDDWLYATNRGHTRASTEFTAHDTQWISYVYYILLYDRYSILYKIYLSGFSAEEM